ncbi:hypothetical protein VTH82DRAFT_8444 [Thermothelomyces myriococcoides]
MAIWKKNLLHQPV